MGARCSSICQQHVYSQVPNQNVLLYPTSITQHQSPYRFTSSPSVIDNRPALIRPIEYIEIKPGHYVLRSTELYADEIIPLTDSEVKNVVIPMFELLQQKDITQHHLNIDDIIKSCSDDLLHRVVRGKMNKSPNSDTWLRLLPKKKTQGDKSHPPIEEGHHKVYRINDHVAAAAEALENIIQWRLREDVLANDILFNHLHDVEIFHQLWPSYRTSGCDAIGHVIVCEEVRHVNPVELLDKFSFEEIILLRMQVMEQILSCVQEEGRQRGYLLCKHIHLINLEGVSIIEFRKIVHLLNPLFKFIEVQTPHTLCKMVLLNAPYYFIIIWRIIKPWLDFETVEKISIMHSIDMSYFDNLHISKEHLPHWCGGTSVSIPLLSLIKRSIELGPEIHKNPIGVVSNSYLSSLSRDIPSSSYVRSHRKPQRHIEKLYHRGLSPEMLDRIKCLSMMTENRETSSSSLSPSLFQRKIHHTASSNDASLTTLPSSDILSESAPDIEHIHAAGYPISLNYLIFWEIMGPSDSYAMKCFLINQAYFFVYTLAIYIMLLTNISYDTL